MLFRSRHSAAHAFRKIVIEEVGGRILVRRTSLRILQNIVKKIIPRITQKVIGKAISRFMPFVGSIGIGFYAYYDTIHVGKNSIELFKMDIIIDDAEDVEG